MTLQEFYDMIESGGEGKVCPFTDTDDHLELQNSSVFFEDDGELKESAKELIKEDTVVFFKEIENGIDIDKCVAAVIEYQNRFNEQEGNG